MGNNFFSSNKKFWGFSLGMDGKPKDHIKMVRGSALKHIIDYAFDHDMEINFLPHMDIPCLFVKTSGGIWHYVNSEEEALTFPKNTKLPPNYPCCLFM